MIEIARYLPLKTLFMLNGVCKSWYRCWNGRQSELWQTIALLFAGKRLFNRLPCMNIQYQHSSSSNTTNSSNNHSSSSIMPNTPRSLRSTNDYRRIILTYIVRRNIDIQQTHTDLMQAVMSLFANANKKK